MPSLGSTLGSIGDAVRTAPTLTRHSRLRHQIRAALDLREKALAQPEDLDGAIRDLTEIINFQTARLLAVTKGSSPLKPQWAAVWGGAITALICVALGFFFGIRNLPQWWGWLIAIPSFAAALLFVLVSLVAIFSRG
jgi:hypothetical protein